MEMLIWPCCLVTRLPRGSADTGRPGPGGGLQEGHPPHRGQVPGNKTIYF